MFHISKSFIQLESISELDVELPMNIQLPIADVNYRHPTSDEVRLVLEDTGLTQASAAASLGVTDRTMRGWLSKGSKRSTIPYAAWRAMLYELRLLDVVRAEPACANWWLVNGSDMADSMDRGPYPTQRKIGPYTSYCTAYNIAVQKNAESFAQYLSDHLSAKEIELDNPDTYEYWEDVREEWLASHAVIYDVVHSQHIEE